MKDTADFGWPTKPLGDLVDVLDRLRKPITKKNRKAGPYPYYGATGVLDHVDGFLFDEPLVLIGEDGAKWEAGANSAFAIAGKTWVNNHAHVIRPHRDQVLDDWLIYYLNGADLMPFISGMTVPKLNQGRLREIPIPVPPLQEQQRIVAVLDEAFEGLARARAHAEANLQNAREFFLSVLRDVFSNDSRKWETDQIPDVVAQGAALSKSKKSKASTQTGGRGATLRPIAGDFSLTVLLSDNTPRKGWKWSQLTDLARLESGHTPSRKHPEYWGGDVPWIGIKDARDHHGREVHSTLMNTNPLGIANSSARVLPENTVCLSRTASVGYVTVMGRDMATSQDFVNWVCSDALLPDFLKFLLLAQGDEIRRFASGSVHQTIYFPEVKAFHICHPPVSVQQEICKALEATRDESHKLVTTYEAKIQDLDDLRKSLLQKAFAGELT